MKFLQSAIVSVALAVYDVNGHGLLSSPRSRNYVADVEGGWSGSDGTIPAKETCAHCLNIPSVCGTVETRNYDQPKSVTGAALEQPRIQATYTEGEEIDINLLITAHHKGHFTFKLCPVQPYEIPNQACFDQHPLTFVSDNMYGGTKDINFPERAYMANSDHPDYTGEYKFTFKLPDGVSGDMVLLQWHWTSANSCLPEGYDEYNFPPYFSPGNSISPGMCTPDNLGEQFWNCAEVEVLPKNPSETQSPVASPTLAPVADVTQSPVASPVDSPTEPPVASPTEAPVASPVTSPIQQEDKCASKYVEGHDYAALDLASFEGINYECKPHPFTSWCAGEAWAYHPGTGAYWEEAWTEKGACNGEGSTPAPVGSPTTAPVSSPSESPVSSPVSNPSKAPTTSPVSSPTGGPPSESCAPAYVEGTTYALGEAASYKQKEYECLQPNWCSGAAWAYAPGTGTAWDQAWRLLGSCGEGGPTVSPVASPSKSPTKAPVASPLSPPVQAPVSSPVASPTSTPNAIQGVETVLEDSKVGIDAGLFLYETPQSQWVESTVYRYSGFLAGLRVMYQDGVAGKYFYMGEDDVVDGHLYGLVNIAAFLAQSMKETIKYDACDENSWDLVNGQYPLSNACGQLGQSYQDYHCSEAERHMECPVGPDMEIRATTNAKWWGAPQPLYCGPRSKYPETGYWDYNAPCTDGVCDDYEGQKAGGENNNMPWANSNGRVDVEGCCWWGRGVIQTTGICNFGKLNYFLGKRAHDEGRSSRYPTIDFCKDPGAICSSQEFQELKWIAGMFYWVESLQSYNNGGWNYMEKLRAFVVGGMTDMTFIDSVSGIVNRGCHNPPCGTGPLDGGDERKKNFQNVLDVFNIPTTARRLRGN